MAICEPQGIDNSPINIKWDIVRGDTATLKVEFFENDEETAIDISTWDFIASAYDSATQVNDELDINVGSGYVEIVAEPFITETWGQGNKPGALATKLNFDLQVITADDITWTPVAGTINVIGDISGSTL